MVTLRQNEIIFSLQTLKMSDNAASILLMHLCLLSCSFLLIIVNFLCCCQKNRKGMEKERQERKGRKRQKLPWGTVSGQTDSVTGAWLF